LLKHHAPLIHANKPTLRLDKRIRKPGLSNDLRIEVDSLNFGDTLSKNNLSSDQLLDIPISSHLEDNLPSKESIRKNNRNAFNLHKNSSKTRNYIIHVTNQENGMDTIGRKLRIRNIRSKKV